MSRISHCVLAVAILAGWIAPATGQQPTFRSGIDLVTVDVTVVDDRGRPVTDLQQEEFLLSVDGQPRRVVWSQFVPYATLQTAPAPRPTHFSSNEHADSGRLILVAVDQMNIRRLEGRGALRAAGRFIDALQPSDRVAAAPLTHTGAIQFTSDHESVKRTLDGLMGEQAAMPTHFTIGLTEALAISDGGKVVLDQVVRRECGESLAQLQNPARAAENEGVRDPCPTQVEQEARGLSQLVRGQTTMSIGALQRLLVRLGDIEGPKVLVLLSEGLVAEPQLFDMSELGAAAQASRVAIYVLHLDTPLVDAADDKTSPTLFQDIQARTDGLARLAGSARGALFRLVGSDPQPFERITRELSGYHLLAFEPLGADRDGSLHQISVKVKRPNVTLRSRSAFRFGYAPSRTHSGEDRLVQLLRSTRFATELPLRVAAYALEQRADRKVRFLIASEAEAGGPEIMRGFVMVDGRGVVVTSASHQSRDSYYAFSAVLDPGIYVLRAAAVDATGRAGSIERIVDARLTEDDVHVSDLLIQSLGGGGSSERAVVDRVAGDDVRIQFELTGPPTLRVAESSVRIDIAGNDAAAALMTPAIVVARPAAGRWIVRADVSLKDLPTGRYVARALVRLPEREPLRLTRPFEKS